MPIDMASFLEPPHCALIVFECQENVLGASSMLPGLATAAREAALLPNIAGLLEAAREAGVEIFYCTADHRLDEPGSAPTPLSERIRSTGKLGGERADTSIMKQVTPAPGEIVLSRRQGMTAFCDADLAPRLGALGISTVVGVGVSLNVGIFGTVLEAVNRGYRAVVPTDCTVADPPEYAEHILRHSIRHLAYLSTSREIARIWRSSPG